LRNIEVPGKDVSGVLIAVRNHVLKATEGKQVPWEHTSLTGQVYLRLDALPATGAAIVPPAATHDREIELSFWNSVKDSKSPAMLESYLDRYPYGNFSGLARAMLDQLRAAAVPPAISPPPPSVAPPPASKAEDPRAAQPRAKTKAARPPERPARKATGGKAGGGGMCWGLDGRSSVVVPCSDPRAGPRAY
jgi:hypothetical protein